MDRGSSMIVTELERELPSTEAIAKMLKSEGIFVSRRGVAKFYQEYIYVTYLFAVAGPQSSKTRERNNTGDIRACVYSPVPENGLKRNGNTYGTGRSVQLPFNTRSPPIFFKRAPVVRIERGTFFDAYRVYIYIYIYFFFF